MCSVHLTGEAVSKETPLAIYGASLETGESGILYHTIGNNGAFTVVMLPFPVFRAGGSTLAVAYCFVVGYE